MEIIGKSKINYNKAVFLDLDNTLLENTGYVNNHDQLTWIPSSREAVQYLSGQPLNIFVVTNQSSVGQGIFPTNSVVNGISKFYSNSNANGIRIDAIYVCPHIKIDKCICRKPLPGLINGALHAHDIDPEKCFLFGDQIRDVIAGEEAGVRSFLVPPGHLFANVLRVV